MVLIHNRVAELEVADKAIMQQKLHKRERVLEEGTLTVKNGVQLTTLKEFGVRNDGKKSKKIAGIEMGKLSQRCCGHCGKAEHNSRTYRQEVAIGSE
jgi:hypothetical protein